jgi:hypothetical protein
LAHRIARSIWLSTKWSGCEEARSRPTGEAQVAAVTGRRVSH